GLLAQHMLPRLQRLDGPFSVQVIGQADIDRINLVGIEHRLVAAEGQGNLPLLGVSSGIFGRAAAHSHQFSPARGPDGRDQATVDVRSRQQSPTYLIHHSSWEPTLTLRTVL